MNKTIVDQTYVGKRVMFGPGVRDQSIVGLTGTVKRAVKSRNVYTVIRDDNGQIYEAFARNVTLVKTPPAD